VGKTLKKKTFQKEQRKKSLKKKIANKDENLQGGTRQLKGT